MTEDGEGSSGVVLTAVLVAALVSAQLVASRALRDGFFLTHFDAAQLPAMVISAAALSLIVVLTSTHLLRNTAPAYSMPWICCLSAGGFFAEWGLSFVYPHIAAVLLYLHVMSLGLLVASGFWSVLTERFDPHTAKRYIGRIGGGATLGGVLGGAAAWAGAGNLDVSWMIFVLAVLNLGCAVGVNRLGRGSPSRGRSGGQPGSALSILRKTPYLVDLGLLVGLAAFCQATYDYVFKSRVAESFDTGSELVAFFALFYMGLNVCTFLLQNLLTRRTLENYGLSFTVASLPGSGLVLGAAALLAPGLASAVSMRGGIGAVENSMFRSGYELLYTPVLPEKKRPTKTVIDVGGEMTGAVLGGGAAMVILALAPGIANSVLIMAGMAASLAGIFVTRRIKLGYVSSLADSLAAGYSDVEEMALENAHGDISAQALHSQLLREAAPGKAQSKAAAPPVPSRQMLMESLSRRRASLSQLKPDIPAAQPYKPPALAIAPEQSFDSLSLAILHLRGGDAKQVTQVLQLMNPLPDVLVGHVIPLLARDEYADLAAAALGPVAPAHMGALLDAIRLERGSVAMARRICKILAGIANQRCVDGLVDLLASQDLELRFRLAQSLLKIHRKNPRLKIPRRQIFAAAQAEAQVCRIRWLSRVALDERLNETSALESPQGQRVIQGFTYITTLLLTVLDSQPASLAIRSLAHRSAAHRGTGLEYLQNVLPDALLREMRPILEDRRLALGAVRARGEILDELTGSRGAAEFTLEELRRRLAPERSL
jgi:ATP:ADP antiporter, AAA family